MATSRGVFKAAEKFGVGDCTADQLKLQLVSGSHTLLVAIEDNIIKGAAAMSIVNTPNHRVANITSAGGRGIANPETLVQVEAWAKLQGATKLELGPKMLKQDCIDKKWDLIPRPTWWRN